MAEKNCKIVMIAMFKNEAPVLRRMLDSTLGYCDFYVMQNNGSTDGSDQIAKDFLTENGLSGVVYEVEEGWQGFGWNRDHLIKYCQNTDHGCDWILKMDCDEVLEIDDDFDWSLLNDDKTIHGFHVAAVSGSCIYYRAWMWNANMPWAFQHDPCHEVIYSLIPEIGTEFRRVDLPKSFRQVGYNEGQSWSVPTKFVSDSLILEEKMIREQTILTNTYHFWYIGKSYADAWPCSAFPLKESQQREYARRCVYYFNEYINFRHPKGPKGIDEMAYVGLILSAEAQYFLKDYKACESTYKLAECFAPMRNDHLIGLAKLYEHTRQYDKMLATTTVMMQTDRVCPFPRYATFIDTNMYWDTGFLVKELHEKAIQHVQISVQNEQLPIIINKKNMNKRLFVVDNFYQDPDSVREFALSVPYDEDLRWYKGLRTLIPYRPKGIKEAFERIIGEPITRFEEHGYNGVFQITKASDPQVWHYDEQRWAAMIYLTPNAPIESGTRLHRSRINGTRHRFDPDADFAFNGNFYDSTKFDNVDVAGNIYNRLVIMDAQCFHSAGPYFGDSPETGRLTHLFFFD